MGPPRAQGRWTLTAREILRAPLGVDGRPVGDPLVVDPTLAAHARVATLLERHGILTREAVRGEGVPGGFAGIYPVLRAMEEAGRIRRGYFVAGLGGAQFALPGAVDRLRSLREPAGEVLVLAAADPGSVHGLAVPWPSPAAVGPEGAPPPRPQRAAGAYVVAIDGRASLYLERGARSLVALRPFDDTWEDGGLAGLLSLLADGRLSRLTLERYPDELRARLEASGFVPTPRGLAHYG